MSDLLIHRHGRVLQLTLNRPQARNALNNALLTQIAAYFARFFSRQVGCSPSSYRAQKVPVS
ncbi:hypothetical protein FK514_29605 [Klebsiella pneumoniae]|nr:hypothetical protein [Klebsiella pneumoniae]